VKPKFEIWKDLSGAAPTSLAALQEILRRNRHFEPVSKLEYGDHGLEDSYRAIRNAIQSNRRIALYADYDVDGTMSCVSWIWFFKAIGFENFTYYIPDRFSEGYGLNLKAVQYLIEEQKAQLIITMDTGITANVEAAYCRSMGVEFICTDHHKIQPEKMPDCIVLNPKLHPDLNYQELCGCGVSFVLLRKLGREFEVPPETWTDILALTGMATICDVVPLNGVNHRLARMGVEALLKSRRPVLRNLLKASSVESEADEKDIGFRLGPRINAVGRLKHASIVVRAFVDEDSSELIRFMGQCNEERKQIQSRIVEQAMGQAAAQADTPILFLGGDWHIGVVGIAASKIAESFWRPTWLFNRGSQICKGSARSIAGFDVTEAMASASGLFQKFGGHRAAGGFVFSSDQESELRRRITDYAEEIRASNPDLWRSCRSYDCELDADLVELDFAQSLADLKPFGHGFEEPSFRVNGTVSRMDYLQDRQTGKPKHTAVWLDRRSRAPLKLMFFNEVLPKLESNQRISSLIQVGVNRFRGQVSAAAYGIDLRTLH
jgi:single-stranded-DNA-specific exonuclease